MQKICQILFFYFWPQNKWHQLNFGRHNEISGAKIVFQFHFLFRFVMYRTCPVWIVLWRTVIMVFQPHRYPSSNLPLKLFGYHTFYFIQSDQRLENSIAETCSVSGAIILNIINVDFFFCCVNDWKKDCVALHDQRKHKKCGVQNRWWMIRITKTLQCAFLVDLFKGILNAYFNNVIPQLSFSAIDNKPNQGDVRNEDEINEWNTALYYFWCNFVHNFPTHAITT